VATPRDQDRGRTPGEGGRACLGRPARLAGLWASDSGLSSSRGGLPPHGGRPPWGPRVIAAQQSAEGVVVRQVAERRPERWTRQVGRGISCHPMAAGHHGPRVSARRQKNQLELAFGRGVTGEAAHPTRSGSRGDPGRKSCLRRDRSRCGGRSDRKPGGPLRGLLTASISWIGSKASWPLMGPSMAAIVERDNLRKALAATPRSRLRGDPGASRAQQGRARRRRDDPMWRSGGPLPRMATTCRSTSRSTGPRTGTSCSTAPTGRSRCCGSVSRYPAT
jgi:hypothetical protein